MPVHRKYIFVIDDAPLDQNFIEYFASFNYDIVQHRNYEHNQLEKEIASPAALLINWAINPSLVSYCYQHYLVPLIVISNQSNEEICIRALDAGADDFLVKPLRPRELFSRIQTINKRLTRSLNEIGDKRVFLFADWRLYPASRQLFGENNQELVLSVGEYDLLMAFLHQPLRVLDREVLLQATKNSCLNLFDRRIDVQISRLRQKIEKDVKRPVLIKTIRNSGYLFTAHVSYIKEKT